MEHFAYSFLVSMMHSLWQAALLFFVVKLSIGLNYNQNPLAKRNLLLNVLLVQIVASAITFVNIFTGASQTGLSQFGYYNELLIHAAFYNYSAIIFWIYTSIVLARSVIMLATWQRFQEGIRSSLQKPGVQLRLFTTSKAFEFGLKKKVALWCSENITTPVTYGFLKPVILLPIALVNQLTIEETETLIIHELTHIKNKDYLWNWFVIVTETVYFFNPFIYFIAKQVKLEREKSCDMQVIHFKYSPLLYAEALLKTARTRQSALSLQLGAIKNNQELLRRIHFFSNDNNLNFRKQKRSLSLFILPVLLFVNIFLVSQVTSRTIDKQENLATSMYSFNIGKKEINKPITYRAEENNAEKIEQTELNSQEEGPAIATIENTFIANKTTDEPASEISYQEDQNQSVAFRVAQELPVKTETKEVLIQETNSKGEIVTIALQAVLQHGEWIMQPLWIVSTVKNKIDSTVIISKDSTVRVFPAAQ